MGSFRMAAAACAFACAAAAAACSSDITPDGGEEMTPLSANSEAFLGLDENVVGEVLDNPEAYRKIGEELTQSARESMAQGIVINFITCRSVAAAYRAWVVAGERPTLAPVPTVEVPKEPSYGDALATRDLLTRAIESGEPSRLRAYLEGPSSCGHWIPAKPGDVSGPTIEDSLKGIL